MIQTCEPAKHLWISVPAYSHTVHPYQSHSVAYAMLALMQGGVEVTHDAVPGNCYLDHTRNQMVARFLESTATDILMVDADVQFPYQAAVKIAQAKRPFVGGAYPLKEEGAPKFPVAYPEKGKVTFSEDGLVEMAMLPTGFLRLNRAVFAIMDKGPYTFGDDPTVWRNYFCTGVRDGKYYGEDTGFCHEWIGKGGKIHMLPDVDFTHWGMQGWDGNWSAWLKAELKKQGANR